MNYVHFAKAFIFILSIGLVYRLKNNLYIDDINVYNVNQKLQYLYMHVIITGILFLQAKCLQPSLPTLSASAVGVSNNHSSLWHVLRNFKRSVKTIVIHDQGSFHKSTGTVFDCDLGESLVKIKYFQDFVAIHLVSVFFVSHVIWKFKELLRTPQNSLFFQDFVFVLNLHSSSPSTFSQYM